MKRRYFVPLLVLLAMAGSGCSNTTRAPKPRPIDPELVNISKEDAFARAERFFENRKFPRARTFYSHVYEMYPNDPLGRRSLLRVADTYFEQGDLVNLVEAQYKYRDFINRYPGSDFADYAMFQIANISYKQMEKPDRDQTKTHETVAKYREMLVAFPNSKYRPEAEKKLQQAYDRLAKHEHIVAKFYIRRKNYPAAITRLNGIIDTYPNYNEKDRVFFDLATALSGAGRKGEARLYFERLLTEFPDSELAGEAKEKLQGLSA